MLQDSNIKSRSRASPGNWTHFLLRYAGPNSITLNLSLNLVNFSPSHCLTRPQLILRGFRFKPSPGDLEKQTNLSPRRSFCGGGFRRFFQQHLSALSQSNDWRTSTPTQDFHSCFQAFFSLLHITDKSSTSRGGKCFEILSWCFFLSGSFVTDRAARSQWNSCRSVEIITQPTRVTSTAQQSMCGWRVSSFRSQHS